MPKVLLLPFTWIVLPCLLWADSQFTKLSERRSEDGTQGIRIEVQDNSSGKQLPVRLILTAEDGSHPDGSGRGVYRDGRFFAEGSFAAKVPEGKLRIQISSGPNYVPIDKEVEIPTGKLISYEAKLKEWFSPEDLGWYAGDNHVHAQHDKEAAVRTDLAYTALQGRANGLSFITEAGSNVDYSGLDKLSMDKFLMRFAQEIRPGNYVGHFNTPGIREKLGYSELQEMVKRPLPAHAVYKAVRAKGGVMIQTHPMTPRHQLHWMGAGQSYSDAVLGNCVDLFDIDANHTRALWFAMLNLGNKVAASSYTDSALGRTTTLSPGDRRVYCQAKEFTYESIVNAMRAGRTMATNGGSVFAFLEVDDKSPGTDIQLSKGENPTFRLKVHTLEPIRSVALYMNGERSHAFNVNELKGKRELEFEGTIQPPAGKASWIVAVADDEKGKWCLTSPVYLTPEGTCRDKLREDASTILFEISNHSRFAQLRKEFFAHVLTTVAPGDTIRKVEILKDGKPFHSFEPKAGNQYADGKVPTSELYGSYDKGWVWHPSPQAPQHFQADWPVQESGWYSVRTSSTNGNTHLSDSMRYDATNPNSQATSVAHIKGKGTSLTLWGHGEDEALEKVNHPYTQGNWWYSKNGYWRLMTQFGKSKAELGWPQERDGKRFRIAD